MGVAELLSLPGNAAFAVVSVLLFVFLKVGHVVEAMLVVLVECDLAACGRCASSHQILRTFEIVVRGRVLLILPNVISLEHLVAQMVRHWGRLILVCFLGLPVG